MKIISHRGYWQQASEKNTVLAFSRSFGLGFGTETDIRDCGGQLVISHDMPAGDETTLAAFLGQAALAADARQLTLALNIKADGLAVALASHLRAVPELDCFVFDMSVPDMRSYFAAGVPVFTRMSEVETSPVWLERAAGVWLDAFESEWYGPAEVERLLALGKRVCIVSAELHKRPHAAQWQTLLGLVDESNLILCTDLPEEAAHFFKSRINP